MFREIVLQNTMNMLYAIQDVTWVVCVVYVETKVIGRTNANNVYHRLLIIYSVVIQLSSSVSYKIYINIISMYQTTLVFLKHFFRNTPTVFLILYKLISGFKTCFLTLWSKTDGLQLESEFS